MSQSLCHVYLAPLPHTLPERTLFPPERSLQLQATGHEGLQRQRYWGWKLLEEAIDHSFGLDFQSLHFSKNPFGKWECRELFFSLSYTEGYTAAAVSDRPIGLDVENIRAFREKFQHRRRDFLQKIAAPGESADPSDPDAAIRLWTAKESIFKCCGTGKFVPAQIHAQKFNTVSRPLPLPNPVYLSLCGENAEKARYFLVESEMIREYR